MSFAIVTDTAANLPGKLLQKWDITAIPFPAYVNGEEFVCESLEAFDAHAYYDALRKGAVFSTSQINPDRYIEYLEPMLKRGEDVLFIGISSGVSGAFSSANVARAQLLEKYPDRTLRLVDTLSAGLGEGLLVLQAALSREKGLSLEETAQHVEASRMRVYHVFVVDDLMHLHRSGRISNVVAAIGSVLNLKPLLKGSAEGKIVPSDKVRGRRRALSAMADKYAALVQDAAHQLVAISHADCEEDARSLADLIRQKCAPQEILITCHEPATGGHIGPGALALFFMGVDGVREY